MDLTGLCVTLCACTGAICICIIGGAKMISDSCKVPESLRLFRYKTAKKQSNTVVPDSVDVVER